MPSQKDLYWGPCAQVRIPIRTTFFLAWLRPWYDFRPTLRIAWFLVGKSLRTTTQHLRDYFAFLAWLTEFSHSPQELKFVVMKWDHWIRTPLRGKKTKCRQFFVFCNSLVWSTSLSNAGPRHWPGEIWRDCWCGGLVRLSVLFRSGRKSHQELSFSLSSIFSHVFFIFFRSTTFRYFQDNKSGGPLFSPHSWAHWKRRWPDGRSRGFGYVTFSEESGDGTDETCLVLEILMTVMTWQFCYIKIIHIYI